MSTPLKSASLLFNRAHLSPRLLSPLQNNLTLSPAKGLKLSLFVPPKPEQDDLFTNNPIQIKVTHEESLLLDSPHKKSLLNYGLNKHDLLYLIGKGSFGTVVKSTYKGDLVAVKLVKVQSSNQTKLNEANALYLLHENIIRIVDVIVSERYGLVIMEYYKNCKNLQEVLDEHSLSEKLVVSYSRDVARGLRYCHENGVLHLDLKPKNVLLCNNCICKICDFGNSKKERSGQRFKYQGTVAYTAPEILKGSIPSRKCDIYSLGMLIWQLLSGKNPYESLDSEVVIYKVVKFNLRPPLNFSNVHLSTLCTVCWNENPDSRPSAAEVCDRLDVIQA